MEDYAKNEKNYSIQSRFNFFTEMKCISRVV